jgi:hypothetical protein
LSLIEVPGGTTMSHRALAKQMPCSPVDPQEESLRRLMKRLPEAVDAVQSNLDRALASLRRMEQKLETAAR